jgi:hypothetical protein
MVKSVKIDRPNATISRIRIGTLTRIKEQRTWKKNSNNPKRSRRRKRRIPLNDCLLRMVEIISAIPFLQR